MNRETMRLRVENEDLQCHLRDSESPLVDDFVAKLRSCPRHHPDRPHLIRMIIDLNREIERSGTVPPGGATVR
jgi:hypothetical protein